MAVRTRFRKFYECDTEAERSLEWGPDSLIHCLDTGTYYKIFAGAYVVVPADEVIFNSPIDPNKLIISGVPDGTKVLGDDWSWKTVSGIGGGGGGITWVVTSINTTVESDKGYVVNSASKLTLTVDTATAYKTFRVASSNTGGWIIQFNNPVTVYFVDEIITDSLESTSAYDAIELLNVGGNVWQVVSSMGNIQFTNI